MPANDFRVESHALHIRALDKRVHKTEGRSNDLWIYAIPVSPAALPTGAPPPADDPLSPAFVSPWVNVGTPYAPFAFQIGVDGRLHFQGAITGGAAGSTIIIIPEIFRSAFQREFTVAGRDSAGAAATGHIQYKVTGDLVFLG